MFSLFSFFNTARSQRLSQAGFGLVELMASITIVTIVLAVVLARQNSFNDAILLRSQAYEIALGIREVQLNAVSAIGFSEADTPFRTTLGVHFDTGNPGTYRIFRDTGNNYYSASEEYGLQHKLDARFRVGAIRVDGVPRSALSIVFKRPNFDAGFYSSSGQVSATVLEIDIENIETGQSRTIEITPTGQIAVLES